jgi:hypothetical protein
VAARQTVEAGSGGARKTNTGGLGRLGLQRARSATPDGPAALSSPFEAASAPRTPATGRRSTTTTPSRVLHFDRVSTLLHGANNNATSSSAETSTSAFTFTPRSGKDGTLHAMQLLQSSADSSDGESENGGRSSVNVHSSSVVADALLRHPAATRYASPTRHRDEAAAAAAAREVRTASSQRKEEQVATAPAVEAMLQRHPAVVASPRRIAGTLAERERALAERPPFETRPQSSSRVHRRRPGRLADHLRALSPGHTPVRL